jgi:hypothetical protein
VGCNECGQSEPWEGKVGRSYSEPTGAVKLITKVMNGHLHGPNIAKFSNFLDQTKHAEMHGYRT